MARVAKLPRGISRRTQTWTRADGTKRQSVAYRVRVTWTRTDPNTGNPVSTLEHVGDFKTVAAAREAQSMARADMSRGVFVPPKEIRRLAKEAREAEALKAAARKVTVKDWSREWLEALEEAGRTPSTLMSYRSILRTHVLPQLEKLPLADVSAADIEATVKAASGKSVSAGRNTATLLRAMFNSAVEHKAGGIEVSPAKVHTAKSRARSDEEIPNGTQVQALVDAAPREIKLALVLAAKLGLRFGEILGLQRRDLRNLDDPTNATLTVARQWLSKGSKLAPPKGKSARTLPLTADLVKIIEHHLDEYALAAPTAFVFPGVKDKQKCMTPRAFTDRLKVARDRSGCDFTMHSLRHFALTNFSVSGAGVVDAGRLAGHKSTAVTERYLHGDKDRQRAIIEAGPTLEVKG